MIEHLLYTTLQETRTKLADQEQENEKLFFFSSASFFLYAASHAARRAQRWLELEKFLRVPETKEAPAADVSPEFRRIFLSRSPS